MKNEDGKKEGIVKTELKLTAEQEELCKVVYRKSDKPGEPATFAGLWHPQAEYTDQHIIMPLRSEIADVVTLWAGCQFVNVVGSTHDPKPYPVRTWIELLTGYGSATDRCCVGNGVIQCSGRDAAMVGGHVLLWYNPNPPNPPDPPNTVYLLPICNYHNARPGGEIMLLHQNTIAVKLKNYMH
jgi:hypothetical protein